MLDLLFAGLATDAFSSVAATLVAFTGLFGGASRYAAVLSGRSRTEVERATGLGFFAGFAIAILVVLIDALT